MTLDLAKLRAETLPDRLRGIYRIPITDGLGPAGGEEPYNPDVFVRRFDTPPIQHEAADEIDRLMDEIERLQEVLWPIVNHALFHDREYLSQELNEKLDAARAALPEGGPDDL